MCPFLLCCVACGDSHCRFCKAGCPSSLAFANRPGIDRRHCSKHPTWTLIASHAVFIISFQLMTNVCSVAALSWVSNKLSVQRYLAVIAAVDPASCRRLYNSGYIRHLARAKSMIRVCLGRTPPTVHSAPCLGTHGYNTAKGPVCKSYLKAPTNTPIRWTYSTV